MASRKPIKSKALITEISMHSPLSSMLTELLYRHIKEHIQELAGEDGEIPEMDEKDTLFYVFTLHDYNKDGFLDGHELRAAFTDIDSEDPSTIVSLDEVTEMVDHVLEEDDLNGE
jgi:hypothetical protein